MNFANIMRCFIHELTRFTQDETHLFNFLSCHVTRFVLNNSYSTTRFLCNFSRITQHFRDESNKKGIKFVNKIKEDLFVQFVASLRSN